MRPTFYSFLCFFGLLSIACTNTQPTTFNQFSSTSDTLQITTTKQKGDGFFGIGATTMQFMKVDSVFPYRIQYPKGMDKMQRSTFIPNFREKRPFYVDIVKGKKNGKTVFVVDENNNKDLTDDTIRPMEEMQWNSNENRIPCAYNLFNGKEVTQDASWLKIGTSGNNVLIGRSDHLTANFTINDKNYTIAAADPINLSFSYDIHSQLAIVTQQGITKDSILHRDLLSLGEFLKLDDVYYEFHNISPEGKFITFIKEDHFDTKIGTQIGMLAPKFTAVTTENDTIQSVNLQDKLTIIANSCGCGGDKASTQAYYDMIETYKDFHIFRVDSKIKKTNGGFHIDAENSFNKDFYNSYRKQYCSRICYVIDKNHRIVDKFIITNWETALKNLVN